MLTSSCDTLLNIRQQTCEPASTTLVVVLVSVFLNLIVRSAVPPPDTNIPCWCGDQATAFTAAWWSLYFISGYALLALQTMSLLSFPPEHSICSSGDHFSPQTYCLWPAKVEMNSRLSLRSRLRMFLSREPLLSREELQLREPTLFVWPLKVRNLHILFTSQTCTSPDYPPTARCGFFRPQLTEVTFWSCKSQSLLTLAVAAFQRYTQEERPTDRKF